MTKLKNEGRLRKILFNARGISVLFLVVAMLLIVAIGYVFSYLIPTKQRSVSLTISSTQAYFLAQSGVEFAVRYAADNGLGSLSTPITRNLGRGHFTITYTPSPTDRLTSVGNIPNASQRRIVVSNFTQFISSGALIIDPAQPPPCQTTGIVGQQTVTVVNFYIKNVSTSSITLNRFAAMWEQDTPTRRIEQLYLGGSQKYSGNYPSQSTPQSFNVPPLTFTINAGQTVIVSVWFTRTVNNLRSMEVTLLSTTGDSFNFKLDPEGNGLPGC